ncbi:DUF3519 domain-containing protein, partial [Helicobacter pylori]|uniref:DUF3519 domain-containing protein n=1 Tax=Helicobacter pylori TaxID=210 RepID=UPI0039F061A1
MKLPKALNEATAGAALKYHIKRALERSHSISDFSKQLELSAKNSKFTNNTLKIIEELNNGVKQASEELKEKVTKYENALKELQKIDESKLTKEQQQVLKVFKGELDQAEIKGIDLNDLYILEQGTKKAGAKKILIKHYGVENTGGLTNEELLNMGEVIKNGSVLLDSFEKLEKGFRYGYEWDNNGVKLRLVVDDLDSGNKIFDFYSDRNFTDFRDARPQPSTSKDSGPLPTTLDEPNLTQNPLTSQEVLLKTQENALKTTQTPLSPLEQAQAEKLLKLQHAITPLKEFGKNYPEFALKPKEALEKLLQEKNGQVAGAAYREDLGGIDFVWGNKDYGLEHILKRREDQAIGKGLNETEAKEYALNVVKSIPEIIEKGVKVEQNGRVAIEYQNIRVGLKDNWKGEKLPNHWIITGYEKTESSGSLYAHPLMTKGETLPLNSIENNPTPKPLTSQVDLLKRTELNNETTPKPTHLSPLEQARAEKLLKLQHAITPLKEFGKNYPEFALKPKEALEKLLQERNGQVAGAAYREDLGGIDFVWGNKDYGLEHILKRREDQAIGKGLNETEAKEYALNVVKSIPEIIEKGVKVDNNGRIAIEYQHMRVGLNDKWDTQKLENKWVISSYEIYNSESGLPFRPIAQLQEVGLEPSKLTGSNPTTNAFKTQEPLSPLEQARAEKLLKLQHAITSLKEFGKNYPEFALKPKEALEKLLQERNGQVAGAAYREDLGGIDFVWGNKDYGLEHILEKRKKQYKRLGLTIKQAKERTNELIKEIPNIIQKGLKEEDKPGYAVIILNNSKVVLSKFKGDNELKNHYMITSFEVDDKVLRELETIATLSNDYRDGINYSISNLIEPNPTTNAIKTQEPLSPLELANAEKLAKLESEAKVSEQEFLKAKEQEAKRKEALKKKLEHER